MTAEQLLNNKRRSFKISEWLFNHAPERPKGSFLETLPSWMIEQLALVEQHLGLDWSGLSPLEKASWCFRNWNRILPFYRILLTRMPADIRTRLDLSEELTVGNIDSTTFSGEVLWAHEGLGRGAAIAISIGAQTVITQIAMLLGAYAPPRQCKLLARAGHSFVGFKEPLWYAFRRAILGPHFWKTTRRVHPPRWAATQLCVMIRRYAALGVTDASDTEKMIFRQLGAPFLGSPGQPGHPLEAGSWLELFSLNFLLLHECAHILANDGASDSPDKEQEFAADLRAFELCVELAPTENAVVAGLLGAFIFLSIALWIETASPKDELADTHPSAKERLARFETFLSTHSRLRKSSALSFRKARQWIEELQPNLEELKSDASRNGNTFAWMLDSCTRDNNLKDFQDQVLRWLVFGPSAKLCRVITKTRLNLESKLEDNPHDSHTRNQLEALQWVYNLAKTADDADLQIALEKAHEEVASAVSNRNSFR